MTEKTTCPSDLAEGGPVEFMVMLTASKRKYAHLISAAAVQVIQDVLEYGAEKGKDTFGYPQFYHEQRAEEHLRMMHRSIQPLPPREDDLAHAACRLFMALMIRNGKTEGDNLILTVPDDLPDGQVTLSEQEEAEVISNQGMYVSKPISGAALS